MRLFEEANKEIDEEINIKKFPGGKRVISGWAKKR